MSRYYIAYGSNLSVEQMNVRCPDAKIIGTAELKDWKLVFKLHATIEPEEGCTTPILVWEISDEDEARLDRYEGFPKYYIKKELPITVNSIDGGNKTKINAMVYIMTDCRGIQPPSPYYYNVIREGYVRFGFDTAILEKALKEAQR
jgi:hypothetical protein